MCHCCLCRKDALTYPIIYPSVKIDQNETSLHPPSSSQSEATWACIGRANLAYPSGHRPELEKGPSSLWGTDPALVLGTQKQSALPQACSPFTHPEEGCLSMALSSSGLSSRLVFLTLPVGRGGHLQIRRKGFLLMSSASFSIWLTKGIPNQLNSESPNNQPDSFAVLTQIKWRSILNQRKTRLGQLVESE